MIFQQSSKSGHVYYEVVVHHDSTEHKVTAQLTSAGGSPSYGAVCHAKSGLSRAWMEHHSLSSLTEQKLDVGYDVSHLNLGV